MSARRRAGPRRPGHRRPKLLDPQVLQRLYYEDGLSLRAIARHLGCSHEHVRRQMKQHGLPVRDRAASTRLAARLRLGQGGAGPAENDCQRASEKKDH